MSHWMQIKSKVKDLKEFKAACEQLGIKFDEEQKTCHSDWAGETKCDGVFLDNKEKKGEGGLLKNKETGDYSIVWDSYGNSLVDVVGEDCSKLMREYTCNVVKNQIGQVGMLNTKYLSEDGSIVLEGVFL